MIKFTAEANSGTLYGFGLSRENINRLTSGHPIMLDLADLGGPNLKMVLMFGETEEILCNELVSVGLLPRDTVYTPAKPGETNVIRVKRPEDPTRS